MIPTTSSLKKKKKDFIKCLFLALKLAYGLSIAPFLET